MMKSSKLEKDIKNIEINIIIDIGNIFTMQKEINDTKMKDARNRFRVKREIDNTTVKDTRNFLRSKNENIAIKN